MRPSVPFLAFLLLTPLLGCPPTEKDDSVATDDTGEPEVNEVAPPYSFAGSVTISSSIDGDVLCDATATLTGTPYTGTCEGCDFAVEIEDDITSDNSTDRCSYLSTTSFIETADTYDLVMAHADTYGGDDDVFLAMYGYSYSYYGTVYDYPGPYTSTISYDGSSYGTFTRTGDDIAWSFSYDYAYQSYDPLNYVYCNTELSSTSAGYPSANAAQSTLPCDNYMADVWSFVSDGGPVNLTVDTVAADSAFDPGMWVNGPDSCTLAIADDNFDCTYTPAGYQCPSISLADTTADTYQVVVASYGSCIGSSTGEYTLQVDGGTPPTLEEDDVDGFPAVDHEYSMLVSGTGTLTAE